MSLVFSSLNTLMILLTVCFFSMYQPSSLFFFHLLWAPSNFHQHKLFFKYPVYTNNGPQSHKVPIPVKVTFFRKGVFAKKIKLIILREIYPELSRWALNAKTYIFIREMYKEIWHTQKMWRQTQRLEWCSHKTRKVWWYQNLE